MERVLFALRWRHQVHESTGCVTALGWRSRVQTHLQVACLQQAGLRPRMRRHFGLVRCASSQSLRFVCFVSTSLFCASQNKICSGLLGRSARANVAAAFKRRHAPLRTLWLVFAIRFRTSSAAILVHATARCRAGRAGPSARPPAAAALSIAFARCSHRRRRVAVRAANSRYRSTAISNAACPNAVCRVGPPGPSAQRAAAAASRFARAPLHIPRSKAAPMR